MHPTVGSANAGWVWGDSRSADRCREQEQPLAGLLHLNHLLDMHRVPTNDRDPSTLLLLRWKGHHVVGFDVVVCPRVNYKFHEVRSIAQMSHAHCWILGPEKVKQNTGDGHT